MDKKDLNIKQVIVVRKDLSMRKGKISAQAAHASVGVLMSRFNDFRKESKGFFESRKESNYTYELTDISPEMHWWNMNGTKKICVYVNSEEELVTLEKEAEELNLPNYLVVDSGFTEFKGVPTKTVLAIGPAEGEVIDLLTKELKLL